MVLFSTVNSSSMQRGDMKMDKHKQAEKRPDKMMWWKISEQCQHTWGEPDKLTSGLSLKEWVEFGKQESKDKLKGDQSEMEMMKAFALITFVTQKPGKVINIGMCVCVAFFLVSAKCQQLGFSFPKIKSPSGSQALPWLRGIQTFMTNGLHFSEVILPWKIHQIALYLRNAEQINFTEWKLIVLSRTLSITLSIILALKFYDFDAMKIQFIVSQ